MRPDLSLSGLLQHLQCATQHPVVSPENLFSPGRRGALRTSRRVRPLRRRAGLRLSTSHYYHLAIPCERAAHTLHERFFFHLQLPHRGPTSGRAGTFRRTRLSHPASMAAIGGHKSTINATGNHPSWASPRSPAYCGPRSAGRRKRGCRPQQNLCSKRYPRHVKRLLSAPHKSWSP